MARLAATPLELTEAQRHALEAMVRQHTSPPQGVTRARIIRRAAQGHGLRAIAAQLHSARGWVPRWRRRWLTAPASAEVAQRLADLPRPGAPATYTPEPICAIVALAGESPEATGRPSRQWPPQELADEAVKRGLVESISQRSVGRFLTRSRPPAAPPARVADARARCSLHAEVPGHRDYLCASTHPGEAGRAYGVDRRHGRYSGAGAGGSDFVDAAGPRRAWRV